MQSHASSTNIGAFALILLYPQKSVENNEKNSSSLGTGNYCEP